jgi:hypothetical protein
MKTNLKRRHVPSPAVIPIGFFFAMGMIAGCVVAHFFRDSLYASVFHLYQTLLEQLGDVEINLQDFFLLALKKNLKYFLLLCFFSFTNVWKYYYRIFLIYMGFQNGLLLSFCVQMNGAYGVPGYLCFLLPHAIFIAGAYLFIILTGNHVHDTLCGDGRTKKQDLLRQLPRLLAALALLLLGCLLEAGFNPGLLRLYFC